MLEWYGTWMLRNGRASNLESCMELAAEDERLASEAQAHIDHIQQR
jgi:hypothetical protein